MFWCEHKFIIRYHWFTDFFIPPVIVHNTLKVSPLEGYNIHVGTEILSVNLPVKLSCARMRKIRDTVFFNLGLIGYRKDTCICGIFWTTEKKLPRGVSVHLFLSLFQEYAFLSRKKNKKTKKTVHIKNESVIIEDLWKEW